MFDLDDFKVMQAKSFREYQIKVISTQNGYGPIAQTPEESNLKEENTFASQKSSFRFGNYIIWIQHDQLLVTRVSTSHFYPLSFASAGSVIPRVCANLCEYKPIFRHVRARTFRFFPFHCFSDMVAGANARAVRTHLLEKRNEKNGVKDADLKKNLPKKTMKQSGKSGDTASDRFPEEDGKQQIVCCP